MTRREAALALGSLAAGRTEGVNDIGSRRELMVDRDLIADMRGVELRPATPVYGGLALKLDKPWEGAFCAYTTILKDLGMYRMYYRGSPTAGQNGNAGEVTCYAESADGVEWRKPELGLCAVRGTHANNVILAGDAPFSHNFSPFIDTRPSVGAGERYKALAGIHETGLCGYVSADGIRWRKLREEPVFGPLKDFSFDSQNIAFWSQAERKYVLYYRTWKRIGGVNYRWVSRAESSDFTRWTPEGEMSYGDAPPEHLYTNQTSPYFRAPHLYLGICARFFPGRQVVTEARAKELGVDPNYYKDCSDAVLVTSRGGLGYTRTFLEAFLRPGVGFENWVSRSNYPALNVVQTSAAKMSFWVNRNYGQASAHVARYDLRMDGFASAHAGYGGGEMVTKPLVFAGSRLELNYSTSAAGGIRCELMDAAGRAFPGYELANAVELIGDEIDRDAAWNGGADVTGLRGKPVRVRFVLKDADLYSFRFRA